MSVAFCCVEHELDGKCGPGDFGVRDCGFADRLSVFEQRKQVAEATLLSSPTRSPSVRTSTKARSLPFFRVRVSLLRLTSKRPVPAGGTNTKPPSGNISECGLGTKLSKIPLPPLFN